jgi:hypothetical protein
MEAIDRVPELLAVEKLFEGYPGPYWVAGGWALDLYAGRVRRAHEDVDLLVLARDLELVSTTFTRPRPVLQYAESGEQREWAEGEELVPGPHALVFHDQPAVQILLGASDGDEWVYHRGRGTIRKNLAEITLRSAGGIPYLAPEIVLLYKSRSLRPKDNTDFADVHPLLGTSRRQWLIDRILPRYPDHPWLPTLSRR